MQQKTVSFKKREKIMGNYFDAHTHLQMMPDLKKTMENALKKGVCGFICNSTGPDDWDKVAAISLKYSQVIPCYGVHPHYIENLPNDWFENLKLLLQKDNFAMVGEIGLDNLKPNMDKQEQILRQQLELAWKLKRPAHIHCVRAWDRLLHVFKSQREKMPPKLLMHSHHGNPGLIAELIKKYNAYFSYSAIFLPENRVKIKACMKVTPLDRIMIESDAPDLTAEPADIVGLTEKMSIITGHRKDILTRALFENTKEFVYGN